MPDLIDSSPLCSSWNGINKETKVLATKECQHCMVKEEAYKKYFGREYFYVFDNGVVVHENSDNRQQLRCHMRGELLAILPFGQIRHQDLAAVPEEGAKLLKWGEELGLVCKSDPKSWNRIVHSAPEYATALACAGIPLESAKLSIMFNFTGLLFDDILDTLSLVTRKEPFPYKELQADVRLLIKYLTEEDESRLPAVNSESPKHVLKKLASFCSAMRSMHKLVQESGISGRFFYESLGAYLQHCALEASEMFSLSQELEYAFTKYHCQGLDVTLETCFFVNKLEIPAEIRSDPLFSLMYHLAGVHMGLVNDLLSLKKELRFGGNKNTVLVRASVAGLGLTLQDAFDSVVREANAIAKRIIELQAKILLCDPENALVHEAVLVAINYANAFMHYYVNCDRYFSNKMYFKFNTQE